MIQLSGRVSKSPSSPLRAVKVNSSPSEAGLKLRLKSYSSRTMVWPKRKAGHGELQRQEERLGQGVVEAVAVRRGCRRRSPGRRPASGSRGARCAGSAGAASAAPPRSSRPWSTSALWALRNARCSWATIRFSSLRGSPISAARSCAGPGCAARAAGRCRRPCPAAACSGILGAVERRHLARSASCRGWPGRAGPAGRTGCPGRGWRCAGSSASSRIGATGSGVRFGRQQAWQWRTRPASKVMSWSTNWPK